MAHINRYAKGLHPLSKRLKGAESPKKQNSVGVSAGGVKGTPLKGTPAKASRKVVAGAESNGWTSQNNTSAPYSSSNFT